MTLASAAETLGVQNRIHLGRTRPGAKFFGARPEIGKGLRIVSPAFEARAMSCGKRGHFIEKEQFRVAAAPNFAPALVEFEAAADPGARDMALRAEGLIIAMKSSAAIAEQRAARGAGEQLAEGIDAVGEAASQPRRIR